MPPRAPPPPPLPAIDPAPFHNLIVNVVDCSPPPRPHSTPRPKAQQRRQQHTHRPQPHEGKVSVGVGDQAMYRKSRASMDQARPSVDPTIRGIPQAGWEDDPIADPAASAPAPAVSPVPDPQPPRAPPHHPPAPASKLNAFRETRIKLSSFSGMVKDNLRAGDRELGRGLSALKPHKGGMRAASRTGPLAAPAPAAATTPTPTSSSSPSHAPSSPPSHTDTTPATTAQTESTDDSTDFTDLFTPSPSAATAEPTHHHPPSVTSLSSSSHSVSSRDRVMGLVKGPRLDPQSQSQRRTQPHSAVYNPPNIADMLPFAGGQPFAAWSLPVSEDDTAAMLEGNGTRERRGSVPLLHPFDAKSLKDSQSVHSLEGWKEAVKQRWGMPGKKVWVDKMGEEIGGVYRVGWERDVMDLEARLHETMYEVAGDRHTFAEFDEQPKSVLDIGTGSGCWPISQALAWPHANIVGIDLVPCYTDLSLLAHAESTARSTSEGVSTGQGVWESVAKRITWQRANFLNGLPFDTGVFDHVHIRFVGLGVPESKWGDLIEEATRVLKRGGKLEIVELSYTLPSSAPQSLHNSFASLLLADMIQPLVLLPLRFHLPTTAALKPAGLTTPVFARTWRAGEIPGALADAVLVWVRSTLEYKGTGLVKGSGSGKAAAKNGLDGVLDKVKRELAWAGKGRWTFDHDAPGAAAAAGKDKDMVEDKDKDKDEDKDKDKGKDKDKDKDKETGKDAEALKSEKLPAKESEMSVWAWVATKK